MDVDTESCAIPVGKEAMGRYSRADIHARLAYAELAVRITSGVSYRTLLHSLYVVGRPRQVLECLTRGFRNQILPSLVSQILFSRVTLIYWRLREGILYYALIDKRIPEKRICGTRLNLVLAGKHI